MKKTKFLLSLLLILLPLSAFGGKAERITMTTQASKVSIGITGENITIDWGDGKSDFYDKSEISISLNDSHEYSDGSNIHTITITGDNITRLDCSYKELINLNVRGLTKLTRLWCNNNQFTRLYIGDTDIRLENIKCDANCIILR